MDRPPGARARDRLRRDDRGQLLLLAGVLLVLAFILTSLTLSQLSGIRSEVAQEQESVIQSEFEFIRSKVNETLGDLVRPSTSNTSFNTTFDSMVSSFRAVENSKGFDLVVTKAAAGHPTPSTERKNHTQGGLYDDCSSDGLRDFRRNRYDGVDDGILWYKEDGDASGHIQGVAVYIYLADQRSRMEETVLYALNAGSAVRCGQESDHIFVNFQDANTTVTPAGYLVDEGDAYGARGNGETYGWLDSSDTSQDNAQHRERDHAAAPDQRYDTLLHMQKDAGNDRAWRIDVADGDYEVHVAMGDPEFTDQYNNITFEGGTPDEVTENDPDGQDNWDEYTVTVTVSDGDLTLEPASDAVNAKLLYVDIAPVS